MDALEKLIRMAPPPARAYEAGEDAAFTAVEATLGLKLPEDYKRLIRAYGSGQWQNFWFVLNPFAANEYANLILQSQVRRPRSWSTLDAERTAREFEAYPFPHPIYPEPGGVLPWALTDNGGRFFWLTAGSPKRWPTVYYPGRSPEYTVYEMSCTELLYGAVSGAIPIFAEEFGDDYRYGQPEAFVPLRVE
jgi:hypothetical protein